jgi:DNA-directed RNA polymerase specialized sigma24 family protein
MQVIEQQGAERAGAAAPPVFRAIDLASYGDDLRRFARRRVRDHALAEDAVQDAMESALVSLPSFQGKSSLKTWLMGILAHKIQDAFRREVRYVRLIDDDAGDCPAAGGRWPRRCPGCNGRRQRPHAGGVAAPFQRIRPIGDGTAPGLAA